MALTSISPFNEVDFISFCIEPVNTIPDRPCCGTLIVAPMLTDLGTATPDTKQVVFNYDIAVTQFGEGSIAAEMARYYFANNKFGQLEIIGLENVGTPAEGQLRFEGSNALESGSFEVIIGNTSYSIPVVEGDNGIDTAADAVDIINDDPEALVVATYDVAFPRNVILTAKNTGDVGNLISIYSNVQFGQSDPDGITLLINQMTGGAGTYDLQAVLDKYCDCCFDFIATPFTDVVSLQTLEVFTSTRHTCDKLIGGRWYATIQDSFSNHIAFLDATEYKYGTIWTECETEIYVPWAQTAAAVGQAHFCTCADPVDDWRFKPMIGIPCSLGDCNSECFTKEERNILVRLGGSTTSCAGNQKQFEVTVGAGTYSFDSYFKYPQNDYATFRFVREFESFIFETFSNANIVTSLANRPAGSNAVTIQTILSDIVTWLEDEQLDLIDDIEGVINSIRVERNEFNPSRIDILLCASIVTSIRKFAIQVQPKIGEINQ